MGQLVLHQARYAASRNQVEDLVISSIISNFFMYDELFCELLVFMEFVDIGVVMIRLDWSNFVY